MGECQTIDDIIDYLLNEKNRHEWSSDSAHAISRKKGIFAIFLKKGADLPDDLEECVKKRVRNDGLLYVGIVGEKGKKERNLHISLEGHFDNTNSGGSTLRRSLGALLKNHPSVNLTPVPRDPNKKESNRFCFDTDDGSEGRLNDWMQKWLRFSCHPVEGIAEKHKAKVIRYLAPPLNRKKGNPSPCLRLEFAVKECQNKAYGEG